MTWRSMAIILGLVLVLGLANFGILHYERVVREGQVLVLTLAPVDPRSLLQGDYMTLHFEAQEQVARALHLLDAELADDAAPAPRFAVFHVPDPQLPAQWVGLALSPDGLEPDEVAVRFSVPRKGWVHFATDAYFFEEGREKHFQAARFGEFRVDANGTAILVGLRDGQGRPL